MIKDITEELQVGHSLSHLPIERNIEFSCVYYGTPLLMVFHVHLQKIFQTKTKSPFIGNLTHQSLKASLDGKNLYIVLYTNMRLSFVIFFSYTIPFRFVFMEWKV